MEGYKYKIEELKNASVIEEVDENMIRYFLIQSRENIDNEDVKIKRKVIETFLNKVVIFPEYIEVYLNIGIPNGKKCIQPSRGEGEGYFCLSLKYIILKEELFTKYKKKVTA